MKNFESELEELRNWLISSDNEYLNADTLGDGFDGAANLKHQESIREYNKRLQQLKEKYGIFELTATTG